MSAPRKVVDKADALCARIRKHVRSHERAGVVVTFVSDDGQTVGIESEGVNVSRFALRCWDRFGIRVKSGHKGMGALPCGISRTLSGAYAVSWL